MTNTNVQEILGPLVVDGITAFDEHQYKRALSLFRKAARRGDEIAANYLGIIYSDGSGVKRNSRKAIYWYRKASRRGSISAKSNLGIEYSQLGCRAKALLWFRRAATLGLGEAWIEVAKLYAKNPRTRWRCMDALNNALADRFLTEAGREEAKRLRRALSTQTASD